jgi:DNA polymerase III delta subunit
MPRKNIITLTGNNGYKIDREIDRFVEAFRERQDGDNIDTYWIDEVNDWNAIIQDSQALGLFASKRLFILRGSLPKSRKKSTPDIEEE